MTDIELQAFYRTYLVPLTQSLGPDVAKEPSAATASYFEDILYPQAIVEHQEIVPALIDLWRLSGLRELAALSPEFAKLARELKIAEQSGDQEVSGFVYAMY